KAGERAAERDDVERPEQEAADEAGERRLGRLGRPGEDHEGGDGDAVLGGRLERQRREPDRRRHDDAGDARGPDAPRLGPPRRALVWVPLHGSPPTRSSWPGLTRPSTPPGSKSRGHDFGAVSFQNVDGRHKAGHDENGLGLSSPGATRPAAWGPDRQSWPMPA